MVDLAATPRTFHSFHASSRASRALIRGVVPALGLGSAVFAVWFCFRLSGMVPDDLTESEQATVFQLLVLLAAIVISLPVMNFLLFYYLDREILRHTVTVDAEGIRQRKGASETRCAWNDIQRVTTLRLGRVQLATVHYPRGKIRFNSGFVDADGPQPHRAIDFRREYLVYPDGTEQSLTLDANELYRILRERAPGAES